VLPARDLALVLLICLAWAGNFLASASALRHFPPFAFTALRLIVVLVVLVRFLQPVPLALRKRLIVVGLCNGALHFGFNFWAIAEAGDISSVAISLQSYIPMTALLAWWVLRERPTRSTVIGIAVAFAGVAVLGFDPLVLDAPLALGLSLIAAATLALGTVLLRTIGGLHTFQLQAWTAAISVPPLLLLAALTEPVSFSLLTDASWQDWAGVLYSALAASLVGHGLLYVLLQRHAVAQVTPLLLLTPVFAVTLGVLFWGDRPGFRLLIGGALVLLGVLVVTLRGALKRTRKPV
jgi:O-acetylserine/cysteine efflux transporter